MVYKKDGKLYRRYDKELLCLEPFGPNGLRVRATQLNGFSGGELSALPDKAESSEDAGISIEDDTAVIWNGKLRCELLCTGKLKFYNQKGELLLEEYDKNRFRRKSAPGEADNALEIAPRTFVPHHGTNYYQLIVRFEAKEGERFYGMGQYSQPFLNLKGCVLELSQRNS